MNNQLLTASGRFASVVLLAASAFFSSLEAYALQDGQTLRIGRGAFSIMPKNSSLDAGAQAGRNLCLYGQVLFRKSGIKLICQLQQHYAQVNTVVF